MSKFQIISPTFGSDPEFAVKNKATGELKSVVGYLGGTKDTPLALSNGCHRLEDNVGAELNIPPDSDVSKCVMSILGGRFLCDKILIEHGLTTAPMSSAVYPESELQSEAAQTFGCDRSYCAYTGEFMPRPCAEDSNLRSFGFHIHVGVRTTDYNKIEFEDVCEFMKYCDVYAGLPSILIDTDTRRRELYGKAGDFRVKELEDNIVVMEYRSLGGNILATSLTIRWAFDAIKEAIKHYNSRTELPNEDLVQDVINTSNIEEAKNIINKYNIYVPDFHIIDGVAYNNKKVIANA